MLCHSFHCWMFVAVYVCHGCYLTKSFISEQKKWNERWWFFKRQVFDVVFSPWKCTQIQFDKVEFHTTPETDFNISRPWNITQLLNGLCENTVHINAFGLQNWRCQLEQSLHSYANLVLTVKNEQSCRLFAPSDTSCYSNKRRVHRLLFCLGSSAAS